MSSYFYDLPNAVLRRNKHSNPSPSNPLRFVNSPALFSRAGLLAAESFVYPPKGATDETSQIVPFTTYVVADLSTEAGLALVGEALKSMVTIFFIPRLPALTI